MTDFSTKSNFQQLRTAMIHFIVKTWGRLSPSIKGGYIRLSDNEGIRPRIYVGIKYNK